MRSYKMNFCVQNVSEHEVGVLTRCIEEIFDGASELTISSFETNFMVSLSQNLGGGESDEEFLARVGKMIWKRLGRETLISLDSIDLDSPVWDTYEEGDDTDVFEELASEYFELKPSDEAPSAKS